MWAGDEARNRYMRETLAPELERLHGIRLRIVPTADIAELVNKLLTEKSAGRDSGGSLDLLWINGENFRTARQGGVLWGPFHDRLPNLKHYDPATYQRDFGEPVEGYEAPWQKAQFVMGYDTARVPNPPATLPELFEWVRANPGRFTYLAPPDFTGSAFLRHLLYHYGGGPEPFATGFDEALYRRASAQVFALLNELKPYLWRKGATYPVTLKEMDRLFANHEIDFAMSYNPNFASRRIELGEYPPTARTFVFREGTIGNYNFLAIPYNASNPDGAVTVINHLLSPESALSISAALRVPFPLRPDHLTEAQRRAAAELPRGAATLPASVLDAALLPEPDSRYLARLERDWIREVLQR
jgi:putative spermidine/putrescine transport system substrate-binding protein